MVESSPWMVVGAYSDCDGTGHLEGKNLNEDRIA